MHTPIESLAPHTKGWQYDKAPCKQILLRIVSYFARVGFAREGRILTVSECVVEMLSRTLVKLWQQWLQSSRVVGHAVGVKGAGKDALCLQLLNEGQDICAGACIGDDSSVLIQQGRLSYLDMDW